MQRNIILLLIAFSLTFVRYGMVFPLVPLEAQELGASPAVIGLIVGAFSLLSFFLSVPIGGFTDRFGLKRMLLLGVLCNVSSSLLLLHAGVFFLMASQVLGGLGFQLTIVSSQSFVAGLESPLRRERTFGYLTFSAAVGQSLGPVLGGVIASRFGYREAFWVSLLLSIAGLMVAGVRESTRMPRAGRYSLMGDLRHAATALSDSRMLAVLAFTFGVIFTVSLRTSFLPVLLLKQGLAESDAGILIAVFAASMTVIRPFTGRIFQAFSRKKMMAFSMLAVACGVGLIPELSSFFTIGLALCLFGLGFGLTQPLSMVMVADLSDPEHPGMSMGIRFMVISLANLLGPVLLGVLAEGVGLDSPFYVSAFLVLAIGFYILKWKPRLLPERRESQKS